MHVNHPGAFVLVLCTLLPWITACGGSGSEQSLEAAAVTTVHSFEVRSIDGTSLSLDRWRGQPLLIVNVASRCGFTNQYAGLQELHIRFGAQGLVVLGFPANDFLGQEPGSNSEIQEFCHEEYGVTFPMCAKIHVKGRDMDPLYAWLTSQDSSPQSKGAITWNFNKFLVDGDGLVRHRFGTRTDPLDEQVMQAVESLLSEDG